MSCNIDDKKYLVKTWLGNYVERGNTGLSTDEFICYIPDEADTITYHSDEGYHFWNSVNGTTLEDGVWVGTGDDTGINHLSDFLLHEKVKVVWSRVDSYKSTHEDQYSLPVKKPIKSDGGSSSYYFTKLPKHLIDDIVERGGIEIKDIVRYCFDNDADCKDIIKALKRIREYLKGGGKEGVDAIYDSNKISFFAEELKTYLKYLGEVNE